MKRGKRENKKEQKEKKKRAIAPNNSWRYISVRERSRRCTFSQGEQNKTKKEITEVIGNQRLIWLHQRQFDVMMGGMGSFRKKSPAKERKKKKENSVPGPIRRAMRCLTLASSYVYLYDVALFRRFPENKRRLYTIINIGTEKKRGRKESQYTDKIRPE